MFKHDTRINIKLEYFIYVIQKRKKFFNLVKLRIIIKRISVKNINYN